MVSLPGEALASITASRKLQLLATLFAQALATITSEVVFTVNVGSGSGMLMEGASLP